MTATLYEDIQEATVKEIISLGSNKDINDPNNKDILLVIGIVYGQSATQYSIWEICYDGRDFYRMTSCDMRGKNITVGLESIDLSERNREFLKEAMAK